MKVVEELKREVENADAEKLEFLQQSVNPVYWFLLLAEYPDFAPESNWWFALRNRCDLPWSKLLAEQPQFEKYCHWESVNRVELLLFPFRAWEIFYRKFPRGNGLKLLDFLTPLEKSRLLSQEPRYEEFVDWDEINAEFSVGDWFGLLAEQPQFEKYFDWSKVEKQPNHYWDMLLKKQPQFAIHCDFEQLYPNQRRRLMKVFGKKENKIIQKKILYSVPLTKLPNYNREAYTKILITNKTLAPWITQELLINGHFFYSHESDVEEALNERFNHEWGTRKYASALRESEQLRKYFLEEEKFDKIPFGCDATSIFKRRFKLAMRQVRISANMEISRCWIRLLKHRPEYVDRCPWHFFQGDRIWQTLQDEELLTAIKQTPLQVAKKMNLNAMSQGDWDEVLKIVPELASRRPKNNCYVE